MLRLFLNFTLLVKLLNQDFSYSFIMRKIVKNTMLEYVTRNLEIETEINHHRIFEYNQKKIIKGEIIYLCEREIRLEDNFALQFAIKNAKDLNANLRVITPKIHYEHWLKSDFINNQIMQVKNNFINAGLDFEIVEDVLSFIKQKEIAVLIIDFNPILERSWLNEVNCKIYEIDGHNIIPARFVSNKQEYSAGIFRPKIYYNISEFLTEFPAFGKQKTSADLVLEDFIKNKLIKYNEFRNNPTLDYTSNLSKYLNLGFISSQRVAIEVVKSNASRENKEAFLEELVVRKELADNFCLYAKGFKTIDSIPNWAKQTLENHRFDLRTYLYSLDELENCLTHDSLWNASQKQLVNEGKIHGYLRMYWAKKILEWTISTEQALNYAIYLNDKYAFDAPSANGYVGILWAIAGLHDRAFRDWEVTGKIRRFSYGSIKRNFDIKKYIDKYNTKFV